MDFKVISSSGSNLEIPFSGVPVFATEVRGYDPQTMLSFIDLTDNILENNTDYNIYQQIEPKTNTVEYLLPDNLKGYPSGTLLVTDRFINSKLVDYTLPLFFQYQFMYDCYINDISLIESSILIRKNMDSVISADNYLVETREYATVSGRYISSSASGFLWGNRPISGNVITSRVLLPTREKDNYYTVEYSKYFNGITAEYWNELIDECILYQQDIDYTVTPSSIIYTPSTRMASGVPIYVQRDLNSFINIKQPHYNGDALKTQSWLSSITCGCFVYSSGIVGGSRLFKIQNKLQTSGYFINDVPTVLSKNIIKTSVPYITQSASGYPYYSISGCIDSIYLNGREITDRITSVDYTHGYISLSNDIQTTDNIQLKYKPDHTKVIISRNMDLNPLYSISGNIDIALNSIGLAIVPSGTNFYNISGSAISSWSNLASFKLSDNQVGNFNLGTTNGYAIEGFADYMISGCISGVIPSGSIFLGFFSLNPISKDMIKLYDTRRLGGYNKNQIINVSGWRNFSDIGYWDGEPFPLAGTVLIQIPLFVKENIYNVFNNNAMYPEQNSSYSPDLGRIIERNTVNFDTREQQVAIAANKYIRDTIERYLPYGTFYIIVDEFFNPWDSIGSIS